ncbi:hypothetical protein EON67_11495 [archaeon]|nr:MAG: hypothetical protein EON67_11495 [archaeon]
MSSSDLDSHFLPGWSHHAVPCMRAHDVAAAVRCGGCLHLIEAAVGWGMNHFNPVIVQTLPSKGMREVGGAGRGRRRSVWQVAEFAQPAR